MALTYGTIREARETDAPIYGRTRDGYGPKLPTRYQVRLDTDTTTAKWRAVWAVCYGNSASLYVVRGGVDVYLSETELAVVLGR